MDIVRKKITGLILSAVLMLLFVCSPGCGTSELKKNISNPTVHNRIDESLNETAALVAMAMAWGNRQASSSTYTNSCVTQIVAQAQLIRQKISRRAVEYPSGNNGSAYHIQYPAGIAVVASTLT